MSLKLFRSILLLLGLLSTNLGLAEAPDPVSAIEKFFLHFNEMDKDKLNEVSDSPFVFSIGGNTTTADRYGDLINFEGLKKSGWAYSKLSETRLIYQDETTAMIDFSFTRHDTNDEVISSTKAIYVLVKKQNTWKLKAGFIPDTLTLGH
tara:strand:+ start:3126 stop:3572 length:447 start_codon:yes stop_codon:yes gene_type:complete